MGSSGMKPLEENAKPPPPPPSSSFSENWKERILIPTLLAGITGGGVGLVSKHRKVHGLANISTTYATNFSIVTGCYCGAREFVRVVRKAEPDDLVNSAVAGFGSGALLGRLQGRFLISITFICLRQVFFSFLGSLSHRKGRSFSMLSVGFFDPAREAGGQFGAYRYSVIFAVVGTAVDFATIKLRPALSNFKESIFKEKEKKPSWLKLPEWSPIQVLDEEALAAKEAREKELFARRALGKLSKEES
ncbi:hypothetical protein POTOM_009039 [Populus tomentosa]|uniref:Mitochondrial import inner membrane translocase subunit Tim17/Tim22/Tim23 family protein n=1 Tax=Populus tomentosa TaxID=118781 RepID=A0A8X8DCS0_POPTO|nr:hypothetical protein POTOM_009039 [Populus tomentosa]